MKAKLIVRAIPHGDLYSAVNDAVFKFIRNADNYPFQSCLNCKHWNFGNEVCNKYSSRPPAEIIVFSCPSYEDMQDIPF